MAKAVVKDTWKMKKWYTVYAPETFNSTIIGETVALEPEKLIGRTIETSISDLTGDGDMRKQKQKVFFRIIDVKGTDAKTEFVRHEITRDYEKSLVRRRNTRIDAIVDAQTKEGQKFRLKLIGLAGKRPQTTQISAIRARIKESVQKDASVKSTNEFLQEVIYGRLVSQLYKNAGKIYPLRHLTLRKCEAL